MNASGTSFVGRRDNNEDTFRVCHDLGLYLVADGMGGHEGGEIASRVVAETVTNYLSAQFADGLAEGSLNKAIREATSEVERLAVGGLREMGTTLAALWVREDVAVVAHVGDSRVYRLRDARLERLTLDHSFVAELEEAGATALLQSLPPSMSAMVTRCIALGANTEPDIAIHPTQPGDVFLLCSDGLTDVLSDAEIAEVLMEFAEPKRASNELTRLAYESGSQDNITCVVVVA
ncbi:MAG: protein phosphatase 2C domain-containing protein [Myxococcota bacterium]